METALAILTGGFLLGLAGSLHCACMCGAIASGALFILNPQSHRQRILTLLLLQSGRIACYAIAGGLAAGFISVAIDPQTTSASYRLLQWMAALVLIWTGMSTAGLLPRLAVPVGGPAFLASGLAPLTKTPVLGPVMLGVSWGLMPCPMVYAALFSAALTGSALSGTLWMLAFGVGTLPGVVSGALGVSWLARRRRSRAAGLIAGLLIATIGFSSAYFGVPLSGAFCVAR